PSPRNTIGVRAELFNEHLVPGPDLVGVEELPQPPPPAEDLLVARDVGQHRVAGAPLDAERARGLAFGRAADRVLGEEVEDAAQVKVVVVQVRLRHGHDPERQGHGPPLSRSAASGRAPRTPASTGARRGWTAGRT